MFKRIILVIFSLVLFNYSAFAADNNDILVKFAHISDNHYTNSAKSTPKRMLHESPLILEALIKQLNNINNLDFAIFTGDMTNSADETLLNKFITIVNNLKCIWYPVLGNHDVPVGVNFKTKNIVDVLKKGTKFMHNGLPYYSVIFKNKVKIIVLNSTTDSKVTCHGYIDSTQLNWLKNELDNSNKLPVIIALHHPIYAPLANSDHSMVEPDRTNLLKLINKYTNVLIILSGHYHISKIFKIEGKTYVCAPALVQDPNGYRIITIKNNWDILLDSKEVNFKTIKDKVKMY